MRRRKFFRREATIVQGVKIIFCFVMIFFVATMSGCKAFGKAVVRGTVKRAVADTIIDSKQDNSNRPSNARNVAANSSNVVTAGAVLTGSALVTDKIILSEAPFRKTQSETLNAQDLSLGGLTIDDSGEKILDKFGYPFSVKTDSEGYTRLKFKDIEVVLLNEKICALVSLSPAVKTPRGICEGSSVQEVFDVYGTDYVKTSYGVQTLYEYEITSADGHKCYLRFAVENVSGKVAYISERSF